MSSAADSTNVPPFDTEDLRANLVMFLDTMFDDPSGTAMRVGNYRWGVYAFYDYDGEPIYVGQTNEMLRTRIRRHLTNQRTDAVAMSVLDPFEVLEIAVWPLPQFQQTPRSDLAARQHLDALERWVTSEAIRRSKFGAILNEKDPPPGQYDVPEPPSFRGRIVSDQVHTLRAHPDFGLARRAQVIARLSQIISERKVQGGLRRVLLTQAKRSSGSRPDATKGLAVPPRLNARTLMTSDWEVWRGLPRCKGWNWWKTACLLSSAEVA